MLTTAIFTPLLGRVYQLYSTKWVFLVCVFVFEVASGTQTIIQTGATALRAIVPPSELSAVVDAYSYALTRVLILAAALSTAMIVGALAVKWKSIKRKKGDASKHVDAGQGQHKTGMEKLDAPTETGQNEVMQEVKA